MRTLSPDEEQALVALLGIVYDAVRWGRMRVRNPWDVWNHRLRAAATRPTLDGFVSRLCNQLGLQSLPPEAVPLLDQLRPVEMLCLETVYAHHVPIAMRAILAAQDHRAARKRPRLPLFDPEPEKEDDNDDGQC